VLHVLHVLHGGHARPIPASHVPDLLLRLRLRELCHVLPHPLQHLGSVVVIAHRAPAVRAAARRFAVRRANGAVPIAPRRSARAWIRAPIHAAAGGTVPLGRKNF